MAQLVAAASVTSPDDATTHIVEAIKKSAVNELPEINALKHDMAGGSEKEVIVDDQTKAESDVSLSSSSDLFKDVEAKDATTNCKDIMEPDLVAPIRRKKSVSFAEGTKEADSSRPKSRTHGYKKASESYFAAGKS